MPHTIHTVGNTLNRTKAVLDNMSEKINVMDMTEVQNKLAHVHVDLEDVSKGIKSLTEKSHLDDVKTKLDGIVSGIESVQDGEHLGALQAKVEGLNRSLDDIITRLDDADVKKEIDDVHRDVGYVKLRVDATDVTTPVAELQESLRNLTRMTWAVVTGVLVLLAGVVGELVSRQIGS